MASLPLKARIACVVAVPVIGLLLLTAVALVSQHRQGEKFAQVSAHASVATSAQNVTALVFRLRAITLAYLMSPGEAGAAEFRRVHDETREALARLDRQARALGGAPAGELTASLEALGGAFDQIVVARGRLGRSEEDGLNLELRRAADEIQALAQNEVQREMPSLARTVGSSLLRLRLAELEFRMTRQPGSAGVLEREYEALLRNVKGFDLSPAVTERLTAALPRYHATFRAWQDGAGEEDRARAGVESAVERAVTAATDFRSAAERGERRNAEEARAVQEGLRQLAIVACVLVLLLCGSVAFVVARSIGTPLARFHAAMRAIAEGDHAAPVPGTWRRDEVGSMARTLLQFRDDIVDRRRLSERQQTLDEGARLRAERIEREIATFGETLDGVLSGSRRDVTALEASAGSLDRMASHLTGRSMQAATSMRTASSGVTSAAAAAEELAATTGDIASSGRRSHALADEAVTRVDETVGRIRHLSEAAGHIERVVQIIRTIADHTNLLALNATIEAARAGEAGRGFSVVAAEVKALATQTARATDEITQSVSGILDATQGAVASVEVAKGAITGLVDLATAVASAVSDQERAVEMIARDIAAASATTDVTAGVIDDVAGTAGETASQGKLVLESGLSLRTRIDALERDARSFFERVRAA